MHSGVAGIGRSVPTIVKLPLAKAMSAVARNALPPIITLRKA